LRFLQHYDFPVTRILRLKRMMCAAFLRFAEGSSMYYKAFVLLRLPVSVLCLCGFGLLNVRQGLGMGRFGFVVVPGLLVFLAVTTRRLVRRRRGAFRLAWRLLLLEFVGAVLFVGSQDMAAWRNMGYVFAWACTVLVAWTAPNALLLYRWRWKFLTASKKSRAVNQASCWWWLQGGGAAMSEPQLPRQESWR
jgi:hypothetical protein